MLSPKWLRFRRLLTWPQWLSLVILALLVLGQLQRFQLAPGLTLYGYEPLMLIQLGWWAWSTRSTWPRLFHRWSRWSPAWLASWIGLGIVVVVGWGWAALQGESLVVPGLYLARVGVYGVWLAVMTWGGVWSAKQLVWLWLGVGLGLAYLGAWQYLVWPDTRFLYILGWDDHYYRLISTWFDPTFTGLALATTQLTWWWLTRRGRMAIWWRWGVGLALLGTLALTYSRAAYGAWVVGWLGLLGLSQARQRWGVLGLGVVAMGLLIGLPRPGGEGVKLLRTSTVQARLVSGQSAFDQVQGVEWLIGRGLFRPLATEVAPMPGVAADHGRQPDNSLVFSVVSLGLLGGLSWWLIWGQWGKQLWTTAPWAGVIWLMWTCHSLTANSLWQPFSLLLLGGSTLAWWRFETEPGKTRA